MANPAFSPLPYGYITHAGVKKEAVFEGLKEDGTVIQNNNSSLNWIAGMAGTAHRWERRRSMDLPWLQPSKMATVTVRPSNFSHQLTKI